jgi:hypothetical protein
LCSRSRQQDQVCLCHGEVIYHVPVVTS